MSPRKLTPADKQEILDLYRQTPETTSTLAERFGVSSSTISRFLKAQLSDEEYEILIQQKRLARTSKSEVEDESVDNWPVSAPPLSPVPPVKEILNRPILSPVAPILSQVPKRVIDRVLVNEGVENGSVAEGLPLQDLPPKEMILAEELVPVEALTLGELFGQDLSNLEIEDDLEDEDENLGEDEDEEWEDGEDGDFTDAIANQEEIKVLPLSDADFPRTCYLVIDRTSELIARPLKDFAHLGMIPPEETLQKTLPVFDNHRVARRFSNRFQRVIKVPDGKLLQKTSSHLKAKGITRLIMDGRIYSLSSL